MLMYQYVCISIYIYTHIDLKHKYMSKYIHMYIFIYINVHWYKTGSPWFHDPKFWLEFDLRKLVGHHQQHPQVELQEQFLPLPGVQSVQNHPSLDLDISRISTQWRPELLSSRWTRPIPWAPQGCRSSESKVSNVNHVNCVSEQRKPRKGCKRV